MMGMVERIRGQGTGSLKTRTTYHNTRISLVRSRSTGQDEATLGKEPPPSRKERLPWAVSVGREGTTGTAGSGSSWMAFVIIALLEKPYGSGKAGPAGPRHGDRPARLVRRTAGSAGGERWALLHFEKAKAAVEGGAAAAAFALPLPSAARAAASPKLTF